MDLVKIEGFSYSVRVQHLTPEAVVARREAEALLAKQIEAAKAPAGAAEGNGGPKDAPEKEPPHPALLTQRTPVYDMQLILPNDEHVGMNVLVRQSILRRYPQLGVLIGAEFEREEIEMLIQNVTLLGPCYGNARQLAELDAEVRA